MCYSMDKQILGTWENMPTYDTVFVCNMYSVSVGVYNVVVPDNTIIPMHACLLLIWFITQVIYEYTSSTLSFALAQIHVQSLSMYVYNNIITPRRVGASGG